MNIYHLHVENLRLMDKGLLHVGIAIRNAIRRKQEIAVDVLTRAYALMLGAWAECRFNKLLETKNRFNEKQLKSIKNARTVLDRWKRVVDISFKHHYSVKKKLTERSLGHTAFARYEKLIEIIDFDLGQIIMLRNKLAHGQWQYPLNNNLDGLSQELMKALRTENILSLQFKRSLIGHIINLVECLVVSKNAFESDFDKYFNNILDVKSNLQSRSYLKYKENLLAKYVSRPLLS